MLGQRLSKATLAVSMVFLTNVLVSPAAAAEMQDGKEKPADTEQAAVTDEADAEGHPYGHSKRSGTDLVGPDTEDQLRDRAQHQKAPQTVVPAPTGN